MAALICGAATFAGAGAASAAAELSTSGSLDITDPTFNRPVGGNAPAELSTIGTAVFYDTYAFAAASTATYTISMQTDLNIIDHFACLYSPPFDPAMPLANVLECDDDDGPGVSPAIVRTLTAGTSYVIVATSFENDETGPYQVTVSSDVVAVVNPVVTISAADVAETNAGSFAHPVTVAISAVQTSATVVQVVDYGHPTSGFGSTARIGDDYTTISPGVAFPVTIPAGQLSTTFDVTVFGDTDYEGDETVVFYSNSAQVGTNPTFNPDEQGGFRILNDDAPPALTLDGTTVIEGDAGTTPMTVTLSRPGGPGTADLVAQVVEYFVPANVDCNDATTAVDYQTLPGPPFGGAVWAVIEDGTTSTSFTVPVIGDTVPEPNENICFYINVVYAVESAAELNLSTSPPGTLPADAVTFNPDLVGRGVILDDDRAMSLPAVVNLSVNWTLRPTLTSVATSDVSFTIGTRPLVPLMGDWTNSGTRTAGTYENGVFKLRNTNAAVPPDITFIFGDPRGYPVAADFNGDGTDDVAVFRNGLWQIHYLGSGILPPDPPPFTFGSGTWPATIPVVGDWDGDGKAGIGTYTYATGVWALRQTADAGPADAGTFTFWGGAGSYPVVGDWNADGTDTVGYKKGVAWSLSDSNSPPVATIFFNFGGANDLPLVWHQPAVTT